MSLSLAQRHAWSLAKSLMVCVTLFRAGQSFGVMPSSEFDGDAAQIIHEYDPWERRTRPTLLHIRNADSAALHFVDPMPSDLPLYSPVGSMVVVAALWTLHV